MCVSEHVSPGAHKMYQSKEANQAFNSDTLTQPAVFIVLMSQDQTEPNQSKLLEMCAQSLCLSL